MWMAILSTSRSYSISVAEGHRLRWKLSPAWQDRRSQIHYLPRDSFNLLPSAVAWHAVKIVRFHAPLNKGRHVSMCKLLCRHARYNVLHDLELAKFARYKGLTSSTILSLWASAATALD